ncbi:MAG: DNA-binding protein [Candidatus Zixiibacteriota bacterium]|nr:MAG: DNA-binding protein [candidate division Zixibacteria bacterium]
MQSKRLHNGFLVRLVKGEEIIATLSAFVEEQRIPGGFIFGLGAFKDATLGYFDSAKKEYLKSHFKEDMEFGSLTGSISYLVGKPFVHAHVVASGPDSKAYFGHLFSATISATGEFFLISSDSRIERKADPETGLNLLDLS